MSNRCYHEPKLFSALAPLMYDYIRMLQIKNINPCQFVTIFKEIDCMYEIKVHFYYPFFASNDKIGTGHLYGMAYLVCAPPTSRYLCDRTLRSSHIGGFALT